MKNILKPIVGLSLAASLCFGLVCNFEGKKNIGYSDPGGIATAGYGHTGADVVIGKFYNDAIIEGWLKKDLSNAEKTVEKCAPKDINAYQKAAFISFAYNVGHGKKGVKDGFCVLKNGKTPSHIKYAFAGEKEKSCRMLLQWVTQNGKKLPGLVKRRKAEYELCIKN